jgi:hypothetical protein
VEVSGTTTSDQLTNVTYWSSECYVIHLSIYVSLSMNADLFAFLCICAGLYIYLSLRLSLYLYSSIYVPIYVYTH